MARLIDADVFSEQYGNYYAEEGPEEGFIGTVGELISKQPTIEAEPVRDGRWDEIQCFSENGIEMASYECTSCGNDIERQRGLLPPYCEFCGARMDATDTSDWGRDYAV